MSELNLGNPLLNVAIDKLVAANKRIAELEADLNLQRIKVDSILHALEEAERENRVLKRALELIEWTRCPCYDAIDQAAEYCLGAGFKCDHCPTAAAYAIAEQEEADA